MTKIYEQCRYTFYKAAIYDVETGDFDVNEIIDILNDCINDKLDTILSKIRNLEIKKAVELIECYQESINHESES